MAKKVKYVATVTNQEELELALERVEEIAEQIEPLQREAVTLKKAATEYAVKKRIDVIQLDGRYYRQIQRMSRSWDQAMLRKLTKPIKIKDKSLWNLISMRVPDADKIQQAVAKGWISEKKLDKAFVEAPQAPFLQRYEGEVDG